MAIVQAKPELQKPQETPKPVQPVDRIDEKLMGPGKYEITKDTTFTINVHLKPQEGRWILMANAGKGVDSHKVVFRMWTYDEMVDLKKLATNFDQIKRIHMIDNDQLNRLKTQKLMVSWTFDKDNPRLKLQHFQGVLTDESWAAVKSLQPNIVSYLMDEMNKVYELNG
jgi:hypothetical protein